MVSLVDISLCHPRTSLSCLGYGHGRIPQPEKCPYRGQKDPLFPVVFSRNTLGREVRFRCKVKLYELNSFRQGLQSAEAVLVYVTSHYHSSICSLIHRNTTQYWNILITSPEHAPGCHPSDRSRLSRRPPTATHQRNAVRSSHARCR
jgi:hypothetical protein